MISNAVNRLMISRKIDATVADFLSALVRYGIIAFTLIAALGRVGVQTASVIANTRCRRLGCWSGFAGSLSNGRWRVTCHVPPVPCRRIYVDLGGVASTMLSVQIFSTTMRTADGKIIVIPNGKIIAGNIISFSRGQFAVTNLLLAWRMIPISIRLKRILTNIIQSEDRILKIAK